MNRREFSRSVKLEILRRALRDGRLICEGCGTDITGKKADIDHVLAEALVIDKTKPLTAKDGQLLGVACCHRGGRNKTKDDIRKIRKSDRQSFLAPSGQASAFGHSVALSRPTERVPSRPRSVEE